LSEGGKSILSANLLNSIRRVLSSVNSNPNIPSRKQTNLQSLDEKLRVPGVTNISAQPIRNRINMLSTGTRTQVRVKIFGSDLAAIEQKAGEIERVLHRVSGRGDLHAERIAGPILKSQPTWLLKREFRRGM
jgi:Cu/Ag efflux pump CusA